MSSSEANVKQVMPFLWVRDMQRSLRFYEDGLGFRLTKQWKPDGQLRWCWLELGGAALMLQQFGPKHPLALAGKLGQGVSLCFQCEDAVAIYRDCVAKGLDASVPQVGNSMWVTLVSDPDGYRLDFESPTDVAEDTILTA